MAYSNFVTLHRVADDTLYIITLRTFFEEEGDRWTGTCHELGTSAYGNTLEEAAADLRDAIALQVNEMRKLGYEEEYFRENGIQVSARTLRQDDNKNDWSVPQLVGAGSR